MSSMSLRARLLLSFIAITTGALLVAGWFGISRFDTMIGEQAQRTVESNMNVARDLLADDLDAVRTAVAETAGDPAMPDGRGASRTALMAELSKRAQLLGLTYFAVVEPDGTVSMTSVGSAAYETSWEQLRAWLAAKETSASVALVPPGELEQVGLSRRLAVTPVETPNGTVVAGEAEGALSLVGVSPFKGGLLVGVRTLKVESAFVDSVVAKVGGTATIFQGGTRISTTVVNDQGQRAIGTVVSDAVREQTLGTGEPYRGQAFVVNKEYLTAYDPLKSPEGTVIGMLYVGVERAPFSAATTSFAVSFTAVIAIAALIAVFGAFAVSRALARPLATVAKASHTVSTGDLTAVVPTGGYAEIRELGDAFNTMTGGLREIIGQVETSIMQLRSVAGEITDASRSSAEHATRQASAVAQTTATLEELSRSFQAVADGARRVLDVAEDALESAQGGVATVEGAGGAMEELAAGAQDMSSSAEAMTTVAADITEMTSIITSIAEQTKILALNAAIEAARAGDAGKGFAVVSSEIRALADSVARSAGRISELVSGIQDASAGLQRAAAKQASLTESTVASSRDSRNAFDVIVQQMEDTALAAREIAEATGQQKRAADQLVDAMHQVSVSSTETAAAAKQLADSADSVETEAEHLLRGVTRFKTR